MRSDSAQDDKMENGIVMLTLVSKIKNKHNVTIFVSGEFPGAAWSRLAFSGFLSRRRFAMRNSCSLGMTEGESIGENSRCRIIAIKKFRKR
jgi:hypothetical protein